ncbi:hypothetical protein KI387_033663 [Taxus chinensis]|uniref:Protein kinase domain-containing protein n=1 Tax=Taxus chinensis TaxID=29808 RepID=A0AA38BY61_TAXCH|nr:hypothetical protein KI387_033663 [Taxus chinensis]
MSYSNAMDNTVSYLVSRGSFSAPAPAPAHSNLSLNLVIQYIDKVLSAVANKGVLDSGIKIKDLVQSTSSDLSKLLDGISQGAKMLTNQKFMTTKLSTEAQTVALDLLRGVGNAHWAAVGLLVIANVLDRFDKISANDRECLDLLRAMLNLGKYMKQLKDNHFDLHREILEKMSQGVQLIVSGAILCHSFIGSSKISKFLLTTKIREELVYVRGRVDEMKSDLVLQMQVLIMSTLTFYISTRQDQHDMLIHRDQYDTGGIEEINSFTLTEQLTFQKSNDIHCETQQGSETEMYGLSSEVSSSNRQDKYNEINGYRQPEMAPPNFHSAGRFLRGIFPQIFRRQSKASRYMEFELFVKKIQSSAIEFRRKELRIATNRFAKELGRGRFSTVYFGTLCDGRKVAVKKIAGGKEGKNDWEREMAVSTRKHHPNILKLVGYCFKDDLMLVFEYMARGNLHGLLLDGKSQQIIDWPARRKIICEILEGVVYLHEGENGCVVHRDIKPRNIILDENFSAKIGDFGSSYILTEATQYTHEETWTESGVPPPDYAQEETYVHTHIAGTMGYIDPEYLTLRKLTKKADIYSFGILLLNIVSGKKSIEQIDEGLHSMEELAWKLQKEDRLNELIDPRLVNCNGFNLSEILRTMMIALWCIQRESKVRPSASQVLRMLSSEEEEEIPTPPVPNKFHLDDSHSSGDDSWSSTRAHEDHVSSMLEELVGEIEETTSQF